MEAALVVAAVASVGAGAIHAAAMGAHAEHRQAVFAFAATAVFQLSWGATALARPAARRLVWLGALGNAALIGAWVMAKTVGLGFVRGLDSPEKLQAADTIAAGLALLAFAGVVVAAARRVPTSRPLFVGASVAALTALSAYGMVAAGDHLHAGSDGHDHDDAAASAEPQSAVPAKPYDPTKPIDLGGVPGVTPEQQARAENEVAITVMRLPKFADPATAEAAGYHSIGDGVTGYEHYVNLSLLDDGRVLDPDYPESLVYRVRPNQPKQLQAAMYMLGRNTTLADVPDLGGKLTQWHIHDNLCFTADAVNPRVAGLTNAAGQCAPPLVKGLTVPMIHVWIVAHPCGPFAALEGIAGGQIAPGETRLCDHVHGAGGTF